MLAVEQGLFNNTTIKRMNELDEKMIGEEAEVKEDHTAPGELIVHKTSHIGVIGFKCCAVNAHYLLIDKPIIRKNIVKL